MSRTKGFLLLLAALVALAGVLYWARRHAPPLVSPQPVTAQPGLGWLPAEATVVGSVDLAALREQAWLLELLKGVGGEVTVDPDYRAFVDATGFDYTRDLDQLWLAARGTGPDSVRLVGVAEGRFSREKILDHVRPNAIVAQHEGFDIVSFSSRPEARPERRFSLSFLDDSHIAFAAAPDDVARIIDCWRGQAPAVGSDDGRRAQLLQVAAGRQAWFVDAGGLWEGLLPGKGQDRAAIASVVSQLAAALTVTDQGVELAAEAECHEAAQAKRLHDNLSVMLVLGHLALARQNDAAAHLLSDILGGITLQQDDRNVFARAVISRRSVEVFLQKPPAQTR